ncbi:MAG: MobA/MobL family protein [Thermoflexales bacterium]
MVPPGEVIFHLRHAAIGRSTHRAGTASAHLRYIGRRGAEWHSNQGQTPDEAAAGLVIVEGGLRKNGRILDKVSAALPRCLTPEQQRRLALAFARRVCDQGPGRRAAWWLAIHWAEGNPHLHLAWHDRAPTTGAAVWGSSSRGSTERLRQAWEDCLNEALRAAGRPERADRRAYARRGVPQRPTRHEGPGLRAMDRQGKPLPQGNWIERNARGATDALAQALARAPERAARDLSRIGARVLDAALDDRPAAVR